MTRSHRADHRAGRWFESLLTFGEYDGEDELARGRRRVLVGAVWLSLPFIALSSLLKISELAYLVAVAGGLQAAIHLAALFALRIRPKSIGIIFAVVFGYDIVREVLASYLYGGLVPSAATIMWALIAVLGALILFSVRTASIWFLAFAVAIAVSASMQNWAEPRYVLTDVGADLAINLTGATFLAFLVMAYFVRQRDRFQSQSDQLLDNLLPPKIAKRLKAGEAPIADEASAVSVLFADIVNFTPLTRELHARELVRLLNQVFQTIDDLVEARGLEKIKTIGDEYMVAAGVPTADADHALRIAELAIDIRDTLACTRFDGHKLTMRIGISSGPVIAGVIGDARFAYDLWGTTVNTASRLESTGTPGHIHVSQDTHGLLDGRFELVARPPIDVKGLGVLNSYTLVGSLHE